MSSRPRILIISTCLAAIALGAGCSEDLASRDDFIDAARGAIPPVLAERLAAAGIGSAATNTLVEDYLGCLYDAIGTDGDLVERALSDPDSTTTQSEIAAKAPDCTDRVSQAVLDAITTSDQ